MDEQNIHVGMIKGPTGENDEEHRFTFINGLIVLEIRWKYPKTKPKHIPWH